LTTVLPVIRSDAVIEAALDGTLQQAFTVDKRAAAGTSTLRKTGFFAATVAATPSGPRGLVNRDEANMLARQARQRAEHAERKARNGGIGRMQKRAPADSDAASLCRTSRLRRIVPGFYGGVR
jgi:hypothetical protein